jgi:long-chain acyl-CoA synthetase
MSEPFAQTTVRHVGQVFFQRAAELGPRTFIKLQTGEHFQDISWQDFAALVRNVLLGLVSLGLSPGETVAIIGENCLPWLAADLATISSGFANVVLAPTLSDLMLLRVLNHAECRVAFVQNHVGVGRLLNLKGQLPALTHIINMDGTETNLPGVLSFTALAKRGQNAEGQNLTALVEAVHSNDLATIIYTSGSTGEPKGVMRTQNNLLANITNGGPVTLSVPDELTINLLSLNHLFGRFGFLKSIVTGRTTALVEAAETRVDLRVIQHLAPTALAVVPRVMERMWDEILSQNGNEALWRELESYDERATAAKTCDAETSARIAELTRVLGANTRRALGGRIKYIAYAAAAMPPRIMRFFDLIRLPLIGSYGSTECGGVTLCGIGENRPGNLGRPFPNVELNIAGDGEILVRGPTVSPGYFKNPQATAEAFDDQGWFHTGDLGAIDADGSLRITGRKKDVFNCSDGSNVYPSFIELQLENALFIRQAILVGDRRPFLAAIIVPDREKIAAAADRDARDLPDEMIEATLWQQIERINGRLEQYERIRRITVLDHDFPSEARSINQFQKVRVDRRVVASLYHKEIDAMYAGSMEGAAR